VSDDASQAHHLTSVRVAGLPRTHVHGVAPDANRRYLYVALALIVGFMAGEVIVAFAAGSLALVADAAHMLTDAAAIGAAIWATHLSARAPTQRWTFGLKRAEILSAAANGVSLLVIAALVSFEAIRRLISPPEVHGVALLVVAGVGVVVNIAATWVLAKANRKSLNIEGAFQHILTDLYAFVGTTIAGVVILTVGFRRADPIVSLFVVGLMLRAAWQLLRASGHVLLEGTPESVDLEEVRRHVLEVPEVVSVHDLHAWLLTSDLPVISAHVVVSDGCVVAGTMGKVLDHLQDCLAGHFDVEHSTFQLEAQTHQEHERTAHH
jgi:cobalt-zinc-cadmium efflux system protein